MLHAGVFWEQTQYSLLSMQEVYWGVPFSLTPKEETGGAEGEVKL